MKKRDQTWLAPVLFVLLALLACAVIALYLRGKPLPTQPVHDWTY